MSAPILRHLKSARTIVARRLLNMGERESHLHTQRVFSAAIYGWILLNTLLLLPYYDAIWGPDSLVNRIAFKPERWDFWAVHLSSHPALIDHTYVFIVGQLVCLGLVLSRSLPRVGAVGVYFFTFNLFTRTGQILDGGNNLVQLLMFYFVFMNVSGRPTRARGPLRPLVIAASNAAFWMCRIQIVLVYLTAGMLKLNGPLWQKGMALYYILQGESYTHPLARELVVALPSAAMLAAYATVAFQILFVVLIWFRPARPYLIAMGVGLHLFGIAFGMGLFFFGLVMCLAYLAFVPDGISQQLRRPWASDTCLQVSCPPNTRLAAVLGHAARLDWWRRMQLRQDADPGQLSAFDPGGGKLRVGVVALWSVLVRIPVLLPLAPLALVAWYLGLAQRLYKPMMSPLPSTPRPAAEVVSRS